MTGLKEITAARPLVLVGCGNMGGAMLRGWLGRGLDAGAVAIVEPGIEVVQGHGLDLSAATIVTAAAGLDPGLAPRAVVFAVKPQVIADVAPGFAGYASAGTVFLSIVAGKRIEFFEDCLGAGVAFIRAMPNTPAAVGRGISAACANRAASEADIGLCTALLEAIGEVAWIDEEDWLDAVTAVSGSGPAYVFHLVECMAAAGEKAGLPADLAMRLARTTVSGSGELLHRSGDAAKVLRQRVTSPGGTTQAALEVLMGEGGLETLITEAILAAGKRSRQLSD